MIRSIAQALNLHPSRHLARQVPGARVGRRHGGEEYLVPLLGVWDSPDESTSHPADQLRPQGHARLRVEHPRTEQECS